MRSLWLALAAVLPALLGLRPGLERPYPAADRGRNILYSAFTERPKHLDPVHPTARTDHLHRADLRAAAAISLPQSGPYELIPGTALEGPRPRYLDARAAAARRGRCGENRLYRLRRPHPPRHQVQP